MSSYKVIVLTPNGRRQMVNVEDNTTILQILEEVCRKHGFSSDDYNLKHHKRILDLTLMFRFSGLPNNGLLEMVEADKNKKREDREVILCLQLEDGSRLQGSFSPSQNFHQVLISLCPEANVEDENRNPILVYMRKEMYGVEMERTTLKSLGLTGGRAVIRLMYKNPEELKSQANVYKPIVRESKNQNIVKTESPKVSNLKNEKPSSSLVETIKSLKNEKDVELTGIETMRDTKTLETDRELEVQEKKYKWEDTENSMEVGHSLGDEKINLVKTDEEDVSMQEKIQEIPDPPSSFIKLGERDAVLFSLETHQTIEENVPDSFFDLNFNDIQLLMRDLKNKSAELLEAPLLTAQYREIEESNRVLSKLSQYKKTVIRIKFPNRLVLQGTFSPTETLNVVADFVRQFLADENLEFHLFTTPPKQILPLEVTLVEANCVPAALLHFCADRSSDDTAGISTIVEFLKAEILSKVSTASDASYAFSKSRDIQPEATVSVDPRPGPSTGAVPKQKPTFKESSAVQKPSGQIPKWFKPMGK